MTWSLTDQPSRLGFCVSYISGIPLFDLMQVVDEFNFRTNLTYILLSYHLVFLLPISSLYHLFFYSLFFLEGCSKQV